MNQRASSSLPASSILTGLLEHSPDLVVYVDADLTVRGANERFLDAVDIEAGDAFLNALDPFTVPAARKMFETLALPEGLDGSTAVLHVARPEATSLPLVFSWTACRNESGELLGFWGTARETAAAADEDADAVALREQLAALRAEGERRAREIVRLRRKVESSTHVDELTGLANRPYMMERLANEVPRAIRYDEPLTIILFDIDRLEAVNERYGQATGDDVLKQIADVVREQVRSTDIVARFGGEEFMVLCPHTDRASSHFLAERLRRRVAELSFNARGEEFGVTISTGLVTVTARTEFDVEALLHAVHDALGAAKTGGRNRIQLVEAG